MQSIEMDASAKSLICQVYSCCTFWCIEEQRKNVLLRRWTLNSNNQPRTACTVWTVVDRAITVAIKHKSFMILVPIVYLREDAFDHSFVQLSVESVGIPCSSSRCAWLSRSLHCFVKDAVKGSLLTINVLPKIFNSWQTELDIQTLVLEDFEKHVGKIKNLFESKKQKTKVKTLKQCPMACWAMDEVCIIFTIGIVPTAWQLTYCAPYSWSWSSILLELRVTVFFSHNSSSNLVQPVLWDVRRRHVFF